MGHAINALVLQAAAEEALLARMPRAKSIHLGHGLCLVPITDEMLDMITTAVSRLDDADREFGSGAFAKFSDELQVLVEAVARHGLVAYVETDYFGGTGEQAAAVWGKGSVLLRPQKDKRGPINAALRLLGVSAALGTDEFDTLGLGQHRSNDGWLAGSG